MDRKHHYLSVSSPVDRSNICYRISPCRFKFFSTSIVLLVLLSTFSAAVLAEPVITRTRFMLDADAYTYYGNYDSYDYDSNATPPIITTIDESVSAYHPPISPCPASGGATITDSRTTSANLKAEISPLQLMFDGQGFVSWDAGSNDACTDDDRAGAPNAISRAVINLDLNDDAVAGKEYELTVSGYMSPETRITISGLDFPAGQGTSRTQGINFPDGISLTYDIDMAKFNPGVEISVRTDAATSPDNTSTESFHIRIDIREVGTPLPAEDCVNGFDDDGDGDIDNADSDCPIDEFCWNGIDDDHDSLIDFDDPDCTPPDPVGLLVRCMHKPIYPQTGEEVTITAEGIDANGDQALSDLLEIYINDSGAPFQSAGGGAGGGVGGLVARYTPSSGSFGYGCRAVKGVEVARSWELANPKLRAVDVGGANNPDWDAQPVFYNGPIGNKIDIVFFHDDDEYTSYLDSRFLDAVHDLVNDGLWSMPWFVRNQWVFNIWIARANGADASPESGPLPPNQTQPSCNRKNTNEIRNIFNKKYKFRDAGAIVHSSICRDNANVPRTFTIEATQPETLAHEMGHRPFGMADEYCRIVSGAVFCDGGHSKNNPFSNLYKTESGCRNNADERPYEADDCRSLVDAKSGDTWWLGEPAYANIPNGLSQPRDLMQGTGWRVDPSDSTQIIPQYSVGKSEINRMNWFVEECIKGNCGHD